MNALFIHYIRFLWLSLFRVFRVSKFNRVLKTITKLIFIALLFPHCVNAQSFSKINGIIVDETGHPLDAVTVTLTGADKKSAYALADLGKFVFTGLTRGDYTLTATLIGYKSTVKTLDIPTDSLKIVMVADSKQLKEVSISVSKPIIERKVDRIVFNVESSIVASGGSAWDALSKSPGVQTKSDGSLTADRKDVQVYLDGKPLHLSGDELAGYLQGMPAGMVSRIEVFTNPPAGFDAEGGAVINIITKKSKADGLNINVNATYTQATYGSYSSGAIFNYRKDKLNIYGSYSFNDLERTKDQDDYMTFATHGEISYWYSRGHTIFKSKTSNYKLGADYQVSNNQVFGLLITGNNRNGNTTSTAPTTVTNNFKPLPDSILQTDGTIKSRSNRYTYNLNYNIKLDTNGESLNVDVDYAPFTNNSDQYVDSYSFLGNGQQASAPYHIYTPSVQQVNIYSGKLDYTNKVAGIFTLVSGIKYSSIKADDRFDEFNNSSAALVLLPANSDDFRYSENTGAAYTSFSGSFRKWTFQAGLRGEYTRATGNSITLDSLHKTSYFKLFPSLFAVYKIDEDNDLQFTYGYRIERPEYRRLNPLKIYKTPYNILEGNPGLQPAFVQSLEMGYAFKKQYVFSVYYTGTNDLFSNATIQNNTEKLFVDKQENLGREINTGLRQTVPLHPFDWWEMTTTAEEYYQQDKITYLGSAAIYNKYAFDVTSTQSFIINKKLGLKTELSGFYYSDESQGIFRGGGASEVDAGLKANMFQGNATVKISAGDIFYGNTSHYSVHYQDQNNGFFQKNDTRNFSVNFSYRLGKNIAASRKRKTSSDEEKLRAN
jgi:hypothetical protein